jgi:uncharacterized protein
VLARSTIQTSSGKRVDPFAPSPDDVEIEDIARALANQCRFGGHCSAFYSVAQHSCLAADLVSRLDDDPETVLWALLHDAAEAYLGDLPGPIKRHSELGRLYHEAEIRIQETICRRFELGVDQPRHVREVDGALLAAERRELMVEAWEWPELGDVSPADVSIDPWPPERARAEFLHRFEELTRRRRTSSEATVGPG